jgi:hypothetical protein
MQPKDFYLAKKALYENEVIKLKEQLSSSSFMRFLVFLSIVLGVYFFFQNIILVAAIAVFGIALFSYLLIRHTNLQNDKNKAQKLLEINTTELEVLEGKYHHLDKGQEFVNPSHHYSYDIDLFGKGSFFQYINRTATAEGKSELANRLTNNNIENIIGKQESIKELVDKPEWRQLFTALASLVKVDYPSSKILSWIQNYTSVIPKTMAWLPLVFTVISVVIIALAALQIIPFSFVVTWFIVGLIISGIYVLKVNHLYESSTRAKSTFKQYYQLLEMIENESFTSKILNEKQQVIKAEKEKASVIFAKFSKLLDALDQRNNMMIGFVFNGLFLRDLRISYNIEKWIGKYHVYAEKWFEVITFFDAENSLANVAFNHPQFVFPSLVEDSSVIAATELGHPLIADKNRIDNDFAINSHQFFIVTGANMAGKSTFLRTVSLGIVMANAGLPVCAKSFEYKPIKLITSMRTSDSLTDDESYFFSELKRLKFIVDEIKTENYFIILDEILKGTNSTDKAIGSKKFVQKLVASNSTGIIATHDLSLCEIEQELQEVKNYYFDAEITNDELHFDYKLKTGVCKNMNASFLLKKMEIV